jgi:hypothetical protein
MSQYAPCPKCAEVGAKPVSFTWWGGILGPKLFSHVRCSSCGATFNGKTGKSNNTPIAIYLIVSGLIVLGVFILIEFNTK